MGNAMYRCKKTNNSYQKWTGYPDTPVMATAAHGYARQAIVLNGSDVWLLLQHGEDRENGDEWFLYDNGSNAIGQMSTSYEKMAVISYKLDSGNWLLWNPFYGAGSYTEILQANHVIYATDDFSTVVFAKTTTASQDAGEATTWVRVHCTHRQ